MNIDDKAFIVSRWLENNCICNFLYSSYILRLLFDRNFIGYYLICKERLFGSFLFINYRIIYFLNNLLSIKYILQLDKSKYKIICSKAEI